jgi:hypothetical protein
MAMITASCQGHDDPKREVEAQVDGWVDRHDWLPTSPDG